MNHAAQIIAALLTDLKARGLLDSTLVIWHSEFGRIRAGARSGDKTLSHGVQDQVGKARQI
jgi:hypothetical protein